MRINDPSKYLFNLAKGRAKIRNIDFDITIADVVVPKFCPILGVELQIAEGLANDNSPSLDRVDPAKGYIKGNVMVISHRANMIKNDGTAEEHRKIADWIDKQMKGEE